MPMKPKLLQQGLTNLAEAYELQSAARDPLMHGHDRILKRLMGPDGSFYVDIVEREDGAFQYLAAEHDSYDGPGEYHPIAESGIYSTPEDAEAAARAVFEL